MLQIKKRIGATNGSSGIGAKGSELFSILLLNVNKLKSKEFNDETNIVFLRRFVFLW